MKIPKALSEGEETLALQLKIEHIEFIRQYKFHRDRKWLADFCLHDYSIMIECQGGTWNKGAHVRGKQYESDCEKMAEAQLLGWRVYWFTTSQIKSGYAIHVIKRAIQ